MFPQCGITDNVVNTNDKVQIFDDLSAIIFSNVGRILLEKNSLTYIPIKILFFLIVIKLLNLFSMKLTQIAGSPWVSATWPLAEPTLPLSQYHQRI